MLKHIALTGAAGVGKTTLAQALRDSHMLINFTGNLKKVAANMLSGYMVNIVPEDIEKNKHKYRRLLQELAEVLDYGDDARWIDEALGEWRGKSCPPAVWDNVRTVPQARHLLNRGFLIVRLNGAGVELPQEQKQQRAERPLPSYLVQIELDAHKPVEELVAEVLRLEEKDVLTHTADVARLAALHGRV